MGNNLCSPVQQSGYKIKMNQLCADIQNVQKLKIKNLQPITFSEQNSQRQNQYCINDQIDKQNNNSDDNYFDRLQMTDDELMNHKKHKQNDQIRQSNYHQTNKIKSVNRNVSSQRQPCSPTKLMKLQLESLYMKHINSNKQQGNISFTPFQVPFSVIRMTINKKLLKYIEQDHPNFFKNKFIFKLYKQGYYGAILSEDQNQKFGIFFNQDYFYEGGFIKNDNAEILSHGNGVFLNQYGKYKGKFKNGQIQGEGKYYQFITNIQLQQSSLLSNNNTNTKTLFNLTSSSKKQKTFSSIKDQQSFIIYEGQWKSGQLINGKIQSKQFNYEGQLKNRKPHGQGKLIIKRSFENGKFHGDNCIYQAQDYNYNGAFKNGKKEGFGILVEKLHKYTSVKGNDKTQQKYQGQWKNDKLIKYVSGVKV